MSKIFFVGEGETDLFVVDAIIKTINPSIELQQLEPATSQIDEQARKRSKGWQGVKAWCEQDWEDWLATNRGNILILNVDASIAKGAGVDCGCTPASATTEALRAYILTNWLKCTQCPTQIIFCIPAQEIDLWVWAALYPNEVSAIPNPECEPEPAKHLCNKPEKLVCIKKDKKGKKKPKKSGKGYRQIQPRLMAAWPQVAQMIPEAGRFDTALRHALVRP